MKKRAVKTRFVKSILVVVGGTLLYTGCEKQNQTDAVHTGPVKPAVVTERVKHDTDDPAIWINKVDPSKSLIIGTDKDDDGAIYVYDLDGKVIEEKTVRNIIRPNNVDVEYGIMLNGVATDIAVATERMTHKIRVFSLPDMKSIDNGGIEVFAGEELNAPMGISLYKRSADGAIFAIVGRKAGPSGTYLWQYLLEDDGNGNVKGTKVRSFGTYSGVKEIESIVVDDQLGYVYYSDEQIAVRKYHADPDAPDANKELGSISTIDFLKDNEGLSIYNIDDTTGYLLVSDQDASRFRVYPREGTPADIDIDDPEDNIPARPHLHRLIKMVDVSTIRSDGSDVTSVALGDKFPSGLFVAMTDDGTFQLYHWSDFAGDDLVIATNK
ncbi:MAG: phytase [Candidatus Marinimicrobia bacterium]|jgi:3-phytase|nr:phytase [Candidatus Neomarinimicrobiota bacterium]MBT4130289.1 phytase [Candidatus Neomarinimicrobiota bacterium]MBT4359808.1 phytase [Candidatus Neomarinimicrobiota bacterium]MBT4420664.1 phytase [Candidatus Neomarinimicrobiota bacterium]MBT4947140.1 phytase [Candidatus Neomarinimicrobiota bacterium]